MTTTIPVPDTAALEAAAPAIVREAKALVVASAEDAQAAGAFLVRVATERRARVEAVAPAKAAAHNAHKAMTALESRLVAPLDEARAIAEPKVAAWQRAERARVEADQRAAVEAARKAAEDRQLAMAEEAESFGMDDVADAILDDKPVPVVAPVAPVAPIAGVAARTTYRAEVVDLLALVRYVAANPSQIGLLAANAAALNGLARALKNTLTIPGVRVVAEESVAVRAR